MTTRNIQRLKSISRQRQHQPVVTPVPACDRTKSLSRLKQVIQPSVSSKAAFVQPPQPPLKKTKPDFCLVMIVRDEAPVIRRCLDSVINFVDCYVICDTGSTDDTMQIISDYFLEKEIPGYLYQREWTNFGDNKSHLLQTAYTDGKALGAKYLFWLDADEVYLNEKGDSAPSTLDVASLLTKLDQKYADTGIFFFMTRLGQARYERWQMVRNNQLYKWRYPVHEVLEATEKGTKTAQLTDIIVWARKEGNSSRPNSERKQNDIKMFLEYLDEHPGDPRATFYLAQSYQNAGQYEDAIATYLKRLELGGFVQERFISRLRMARLFKGLERYDEGIDILKPALVHFPARLEGWLETILLYRAKKDWNEAFKVVVDAPIGQQPNNSFLFYEDDVYSWRFLLEASITAHFANQPDTAVKWGRMLLADKTYPEDKQTVIVNNMDFFLKKQREAAKTGTNIIVVDNFLDNPDEVRKFALQQDFSVKGNYPGGRTKSFATPELKQRLEAILGRPITGWGQGYNGAYQLATAQQTSWIHRDRTDYAGILYLTPDAPSNSGTNFYRHKKLGTETENELNQKHLDKDSRAWDNWEQVDSVGNKYNRLILFNGRRSHMSGPYFGNSKETGRLFQTFFFNL